MGTKTKKSIVAKKPWTFGCLPVLFLFFTFSVNATNYYVSNTGDDSKAGTTTQTAWKTLNKVNKSKFAPGDSILFERGGVWREKLIVSSSGASGNPIVFGAYGSGANPVIDGADIIRGMTSAGGNIWQKAGITIQPYIMYLNGTGGRRQTSVEDCNSTGKWFWDSETDVLYVYSTTDPSGNVELGHRNTIVNLNGKSNITLNNLTVQHSNGNAVRGISAGNVSTISCTVQKNALNGIYISNGSNLTFNDNVVTDNGFFDTPLNGNGNGVKVLATVGGISDMVFTNNEVSYSGAYNTVFRTANAAPRMKNVTIHGNSFDNALGAGLYIQMTDSVDIYNNTFDSNGDSIHAEEDYAIGVQACSNVNIYQNTIENTMGNASAIEVYADELAENGNAHNVKIFRNSFSGTAHRTISITGYGNNSHQNLEIYSNVITGSVSLPIALLGDDSGTRDTVNIFNNTFYGNAGRVLYIYKDWPVVLKNNIFYSDVNILVTHLSAVEGFLTTSNNLYVRTNGGTLVNYRGTYTSATITDFEPSAQKTDPLFTDAANRDFTLKTGSPAINKGIGVGLTHDILGNPIAGKPDIGAFESKERSEEAVTKYTTEEISICKGTAYQGWTTTGQYERTLTAASGADSIVTTNLTVHPVYFVSEDIHILEGENYQGWTESGQYKRKLTAVTGCDSIVTTNLTVTLKKKYTTEKMVICEGSAYEGWTTSGQYQRELTAASGADSIVTTNLTVTPVVHVSEGIAILEGESYLGWTETGQYERTLTAVTGCDSIVTTSLFVQPLQIQSIVLEEGWNIFSSCLIPSDLALEDVLKNLQINNFLIEVQDESGKTCRESENGWSNDIGEIQVSKGYKIWVRSSCVLEITGHPVKLPLNIELKKGWNIISFPYNGIMDAMEVIQPLINAGILEKVQDEQGNSIENWDNLLGWINGIGNFKAGEGYLVQVNQNGVLTIPANYSKSGLILANETKTEYFKVMFEGNGSGHMNINIKNLDESGLTVGDEIAAFDGEICVGTVKINESNIHNNAVGIQTSVSDNEIINGFTEGKPIKLSAYSRNKSAEFQPKFELMKGNLEYQKHKSVFVRFIDWETIGFIASNSIAMDICPNPASEKVMIKFSQLPETGTQIILTDITGKQLMIRQVQSKLEVLNIQSLSAGLYLLKVSSGEDYTVKKLIIN